MMPMIIVILSYGEFRAEENPSFHRIPRVACSIVWVERSSIKINQSKTRITSDLVLLSTPASREMTILVGTSRWN